MAAMPHQLLVVDDEPDLRTLYELTLVREGHDVECVGSVSDALAALERQAFDLVITDMRLPDGQGLDLLKYLERGGRSERSVVITAFGSAENAVTALKAGAFDYLTKPVDLRQLRAVVAAALGRSQPSPGGLLAGEAPPVLRPGAGSRPELARLVGDSIPMAQVRHLVEKVARSMAPVLVTGESGTGKELVARAIHEASSRASGPFVPVNCGAIPETLLEAEFFGYRKGAFTGASDDRAGFFQAAHGGTLFLDEIGDLPLQMQSKLLRAVQERSFRPLGATAEVPCSARIVSATHRELTHEVAAGRFRQDLYFRLNVIHIPIPPLRERLGDLAAICMDILQRISVEAGVRPVPVLTPEALRHLASYTFPGNVRELENLLHRALALSGADKIGVDDLGGIPWGDTVSDSAALDSRTLVARDSPVLAGIRSAPLGPGAGADNAHGAALAALPSDLAAYLDGVEKAILERALVRHRFNRTAAGASLGLSLRQMRYRMARLGIGTESETPDSV